MAHDTTHRPIVWSTLDEYEGSPEVLAKRGFAEWNTKPAGFTQALEDLPLSEQKVRRRTFLKLGGFAAVLAAAAGCQKPLEHIVPYVKAPEEQVPGVANYYATSFGAYGVIAKVRDGRPIKLEGNPAHPLNMGRLSAAMQASLVDLYDPDRIVEPIQPKKADGRLAWDAADARVVEALRKAGTRAVLLTSTTHGPARLALLAEFKKTFPGLRHVVHEAMSEVERIDARELCYGERVVPQYDFAKSEVTVLLGSDPMADGVASISDMAGIAEQRKVRAGGDGTHTMGRLYAFEPIITQSGMNADVRIAVKPSQLLDLAKAIAAQLAADGHTEISGVRVDVDPKAVEGQLGLPAGTIKKVADDLWAHKGRSLVYAGGMIARTPDIARLHVAANLLNSMLGNEGATVDASRPLNLLQGSTQDMLALVEDMKAGNVDVLLMEGVNPAYSLPESAGFKGALAKVGLSVSFDRIRSETSDLCDLILPGKHYLESWGDGEPAQGVLALQQPTIGALKGWKNRQFEESLLSFARLAGSRAFDTTVTKPNPADPAKTVTEVRATTWHEYLKGVWQRDIHAGGGFAASFQDFWFAALRAGVIDMPSRISAKAGARSLKLSSALDAVAGPSTKASTPELVVYAMTNLYDGSQANNPFLLELPDPVQRVCWDNFALVAPKTAKVQKLEDGDYVAITANGATVDAPVRVAPGTHPDVVAIGTGWGRKVAGSVGSGEGFNAFAVGKVEGGNVFHSGSAFDWKKTGEKTRLADTQGHNYMKLRPKGEPLEESEPERQIVQSTSLELFNKDQMAAQPYYHIPYWASGEKKPDIWDTKDFPYVQHKWAMTIDLNACNGCNACMVACQTENNIPVVGKREVLVGREMHWIRIDRYYKGDPDMPEVVKQPMLCQHCDNAPCETVCPVLATVHSDDGINQQAYNRCVGTRYCANNCPYKVRRFNWYDYSRYRKGPHEDQKIPETPLALAFNPDITVRTRGIMEKCTFCQQRVRDAKDVAKKEGRNIPDGSPKTACQQTCPAQAISFGDALNPEHQVNAIRAENAHKRGYGVLEELNTVPAVMYLAHVWNRETSPYDVDNAEHHEHQRHGLHKTGNGDGHGHDGHGDGGHHDDHAPAAGEHHSTAPRRETGARS